VNSQPRREDFPTRDAYLLAWYTWRALQRDGRLNDEEVAAAYAVKEARVRQLFAEPTA
jgi:hypothetical protein